MNARTTLLVAIILVQVVGYTVAKSEQEDDSEPETRATLIKSEKISKTKDSTTFVRNEKSDTRKDTETKLTVEKTRKSSDKKTTTTTPSSITGLPETPKPAKSKPVKKPRRKKPAAKSTPAPKKKNDKDGPEKKNEPVPPTTTEAPPPPPEPTTPEPLNPWSATAAGKHTPEGIYIEVMEKPKNCKTVSKKGDYLTTDYVGTFPNGKKFDSTYDRKQPMKYRLGDKEVIVGCEIATTGMCVGEVRRTIIPARYAYGDTEHGSIPPGSVLHFEITLTDLMADPFAVFDNFMG